MHMDVQACPTLTKTLSIKHYVVVTPHKYSQADCLENKNIMDREVYDGLVKIY